MSEPTITGLPVAGYRPQTAFAVDLVNAFKQDEELLLRDIDRMAERDDIDKRWLSIGRTHVEQAFMAINRSVFRPSRVVIDGEVS